MHATATRTPICWRTKAGPHAGGVLGVWSGRGTAGRWDGDEHGMEWRAGYAIYHQEAGDGGGAVFALYTCDGRGNGDHLGDFDALAAAQEAAEVHDADPVSWFPYPHRTANAAVAAMTPEERQRYIGIEWRFGRCRVILRSNTGRFTRPYTRCERCGLEVDAASEVSRGPCPRCGCDLRVLHR